MYSLSEIREFARTGETMEFVNGLYTILVENGKAQGMAPSCWTPRPIWDPSLGVLPSEGWRRIK